MLSLNSAFNAKSVEDRSLEEERMANSSYSPTRRNWRQPEADHDFGSLKPRRRSLYPSITSAEFLLPDVTLDMDKTFPMKHKVTTDCRGSNSSITGNYNKAQMPQGPIELEGKTEVPVEPFKPAARRSVSSIQTLPTITSDCSAEDLEAIQAALYTDDEDKVEDEERSKSLAQKMIREELGLTPQTQPEKGETKEAAKKRRKSSTQDLIYQLCLKLDDVHMDVKSENWQMLAPHEINKLEVFSYCKSTGTGCEETCLICQHDYKQNDKLRKLRCGHCFHRECVDPWLLKRDRCPICRKTIDED